MGIYNINGLELENKFVRVTGFNVGNFAMGASGNPQGTNEMYENFLKTFQSCNPNIYMFSEWDVNWNNTKTSIETWGFLKRYHFKYIKTGSGIYAGQMIYSDFPLTNEFHKDFILNSSYYFIDTTIYINCKPVHFICTHFSTSTDQIRQAQIQEILNYISNNNIEYYVIGGDMNLGLHRDDDLPQTEEVKLQMARNDVTLLESRGGYSLQGSKWGKPTKDGFFNTAGNTEMYASWVNCFDNFVVSPNITVRNVFTVVSEASDHNPLTVDLIIN